MITVEETDLTVIAHDLKEPLSTMRQLSFTLEPSKTRDQLIFTSEQALKHVNDLLKFARLEDGLFELEPVSAPAVCADVVKELRYLYRENHKSLAEKYNSRAPLALANRELLRSIVYNFTTNALHYSDANSTATISTSQSGGRLRISVRDQGPALPAKIWRELQNGWLDRPVSIAMRPGSSGLGLYLSTKFARHMGAKIGAIRHRDGTTFYLDLPISAQLSLF